MTKIQRLALVGAALAALSRVIAPAHAAWDPAKHQAPTIWLCVVHSPDNTLHIRTTPNGRIIDEFPDKQEVTIEDRQGDWVFVEGYVKDYNGMKHGWVYGPKLNNCSHFRENEAD
jgi:hypothetical protein